MPQRGIFLPLRVENLVFYTFVAGGVVFWVPAIAVTFILKVPAIAG